MPEYVEGFALENFRGVGPVLQELGAFKTFNFFVGANTSGNQPSLTRSIAIFGSTKEPTFTALDTYIGQKA
ncbi:hypothetical protein [Bradyrhizobium sp. BR 1432]|uniref:hypothetical protein n=1 Tax=Bradyrhizobium sp. BR 1432 TaxID=3447966 RepID=UPI003EE519B7